MDYHNEYSNQFLSYNAQDSLYDDRHAQFNAPPFSFQVCMWCRGPHLSSEYSINFSLPQPKPCMWCGAGHLSSECWINLSPSQPTPLICRWCRGGHRSYECSINFATPQPRYTKKCLWCRDWHRSSECPIYYANTQTYSPWTSNECNGEDIEPMEEDDEQVLEVQHQFQNIDKEEDLQESNFHVHEETCEILEDEGDNEEIDVEDSSDEVYVPPPPITIIYEDLVIKSILSENPQKESYILEVIIEPMIIFVEYALYYLGVREHTREKQRKMLPRKLPHIWLYP